MLGKSGQGLPYDSEDAVPLQAWAASAKFYSGPLVAHALAPSVPLGQKRKLH